MRALGARGVVHAVDNQEAVVDVHGHDLPDGNPRRCAWPGAPRRLMIWLRPHSNETGRGGHPRRVGLDGGQAGPSNSSTSSEVEVAFIWAASVRVTRFQGSSPVASRLATVCLRVVPEKPTIVGVLLRGLKNAVRGEVASAVGGQRPDPADRSRRDDASKGSWARRWP